MGEAYRAALRDYPRRVRFPLVLVLSVLACLPIVKGVVEDRDWTGEYAFLIGAMILVVWTGLVSSHLKQVLARPQSQLLPGYRGAHLRAAFTLLIPATIVAHLGAGLVGFDPLGATSIVVLLFALYWTWPYLFEHGGMLVLFGPSILWVLTVLTDERRIQKWPEWIGLGSVVELWYALLIVLSLALIAWVTRRMLCIRESSFEYTRDPTLGWRRNSSPDSDTPFISFFQNLVPWLGRYRIAPRESMFRASTWDRIQHWRRGMGPRAPIVSGLSMAGITALVGAFFEFVYDETGKVAIGILIMYLYMFPFVRHSYTQRRRERFGTESLYPTSRERFVGEMGAAHAIDILGCWFFLCLGVAVIRAAGLFSMMSWVEYAALTLMSLGSTLFGIGLTPWVLQLNGDKIPSFTLNMILVAAVGGPTLALFKMDLFLQPMALLGTFAALTGLGALGAWHGYRRWCSLELGRESF